jgi:hypothetical protein
MILERDHDSWEQNKKQWKKKKFWKVIICGSSKSEKKNIYVDDIFKILSP